MGIFQRANICLFGLFASLWSFDLSVDTLYAFQFDSTERSETFFENTTGRTIVFDSFDLEEIELHGDQYNLQFELRTPDSNGVSMRTKYQFEREGAYVHGTRKRSAIVYMGEVVTINDLQLDLCLWCMGLPKRSAIAAMNDLIIFKLIVHAGKETASVIIASKQRVAKPEAPSGLTAEALSENDVKLTWDPAQDDATEKWRVYREGDLVGVTSQPSLIDSSLSGDLTVFYRICAVNSIGMESEKTSSISVTTPSDSKPPKIDNVGCFHGPTKVWVIFNEPLDTTTAQDKLNYVIDNGISVKSAKLLADYRTVELAVDSLSVLVDYTLTVSGVYDMSDLRNRIEDNSTAGFRLGGVFDDFDDNSLDPVWQQVDYDNWNGSSVNETGKQLEVTARGTDVNGVNNEFVGIYRDDVYGDFDISVKVVSFTNTDRHARCGIMAANDLTDLSKGGYCISGTFPQETYMAANDIGTIGQIEGYAPGGAVNLPCWLRLKRTGDSFSFYYKNSELTDWTEIKSGVTPLQTAANSQICLFACSHNTGAEATAVFDDFNAGSSGRTPPPIIPITVPVKATIQSNRGMLPLQITHGMAVITLPPIQWQAHLADASGKTIISYDGTGNGILQLPATKLSSGLYFFRLMTPSKQYNITLPVVE
ncbi:MAG: hypothetical protein GF401_12295 [Chitinivibrionales bacterium]|nr:hypothetical protein [Chitinivibrionales bacterium]